MRLPPVHFSSFPGRNLVLGSHMELAGTTESEGKRVEDAKASEAFSARRLSSFLTRFEPASAFHGQFPRTGAAAMDRPRVGSEARRTIPKPGAPRMSVTCAPVFSIQGVMSDNLTLNPCQNSESIAALPPAGAGIITTGKALPSNELDVDAGEAKRNQN